MNPEEDQSNKSTDLYYKYTFIIRQIESRLDIDLALNSGPQ